MGQRSVALTCTTVAGSDGSIPSCPATRGRPYPRRMITSWRLGKTSNPPGVAQSLPAPSVGVVQWQNTSLPSWLRGSDSRHRLQGHESGPSPPFLLTARNRREVPGGMPPHSAWGEYTGMSPSGKAWDFGPHIRWFEPSHPRQSQIPYGALPEVRGLSSGQI